MAMNKKNPADMQNLLIALVLSIMIMAGWQYFIENPREQQDAINHKLEADADKAQAAQAAIEVAKPREELLAESPRIQINSSSLHGSIELRGLFLNDLTLAKYHETLDPTSKEVTLLSPSKGADTYFVEFGWISENKAITLPTQDTVWTADIKELTPTHPVNFTWNNGGGVTFLVTITLDDNYMFTVNTSAKDASGKAINLQYYALVNRVYDVKAHPSAGILHEGPIGAFDGVLKEIPYKKVIEAPYNEALNQRELTYNSASIGWGGITDKYWLAAIIPSDAFSSTVSYYQLKGREHFQSYVKSEKAEPSSEFHIFAGAKKMELLDSYSTTYKIPLFDHAVDLGLFDFLTKPILKLLTYFYKLTGNFGLAIMLLTVLVKILMFPMANKSFRSMNQMKKLQPKILDIRERFKDDKVRLNQETMELYKREKVNPASGCLPAFIQIPVFFSLYKVLYVTLEMRQAPFFGWIHDLSAPDPTNIFTLFGAVPWDAPSALHLGIWPMVFCITMIIQQHLSPPPPDPTQAKIMKFMPLVFLFVFSNVASGLAIYWSWSNALTILQQWVIKRAHEEKK